MAVTVRAVRAEDYPQWRPLWDGYTHFYDCVLDESVTASTWERALDPHSSMFCRVAESEGRVIGFAMCVLHEGTWSTAPLCYLEDLFVDATQRGAGTGQALIDALMEEGKREGWSKLYWVTRQNNPARKLYDRFGEADDYVRYRISL
ncbi:GNAT family N-acetyltransferase [Enterobacter soli]|jgi:GNAT superfamily N-acetyltransferase|uniref:GNAT family N-acetyltransferase n=1 Tax=Enterobacter soli TaxID=885040 RepID=A0AAW8H5A0_9ENTR|nr:GNAT family N-acetyltransferase [Enterobacter soli]MDQ2256150.1 GNAT family N-acetyltransferase [Enterobacter soli]MDQ2337711.1 GNAT family N-acetyltransferase [Enterobacter soli]HEE9786635.1 GNAT family N-acetyltransferase [Enterobacter soli]